MKLPKGFTTIAPPYKHQIESIAYGIVHENAGILLDLGLGKSYVAVNIGRYRIQQNNIKKILVVCPTSILLNWQNEITKYSEYKSIILHAPRQERIARIKAFNGDYQFGIINYEALYKFMKYIARNPIDMLIFDESARYIKNHEALRTKAATWLADKVRYKLILTGTPIANHPLNLYSQFRALDGGKTFGDNYWKFRNRYFDNIKIGEYVKWRIQPKYIKTLHKKIYSTCIRRTKAECIDLPKQLFQSIELELTGSLKHTYETVQKEVLAEIDTLSGPTQLKIQNMLVKLLKLQQVTSGFAKDIYKKESVLTETPKLDALVEQVDSIVDAEESVVIFCRFLKSIDMIAEALRNKDIKCITMSGKNKDKYDRWKTFQSSKTIPVFIAQIDSGGIGIELFKIESTASVQHMIFYENTYSLDVRDQAIGRIHRIGQKSICLYTDIIIKGTIDEKILNTLKGSKTIADAIIESGVRGFLKN